MSYIVFRALILSYLQMPKITGLPVIFCYEVVSKISKKEKIYTVIIKVIDVQYVAK